jgi:hypothetical protein
MGKTPWIFGESLQFQRGHGIVTQLVVKARCPVTLDRAAANFKVLPG